MQPSRGNYYEAGASKAFLNHLRLDTKYYRRDVRNYADDDQLLNTGVSYPIAFNHAIISGIDTKLTLIDSHGWSGYASYSYMVGNVWFPVTGGLFLGDDATDAISQTGGHLPDSQHADHSREVPTHASGLAGLPRLLRHGTTLRVREHPSG